MGGGGGDQNRLSDCLTSTKETPNQERRIDSKKKNYIISSNQGGTRRSTLKRPVTTPRRPGSRLTPDGEEKQGPGGGHIEGQLALERNPSGLGKGKEVH